MLFSYWAVSDSCNPTDCSPPGSSVHGISQARILERVAISCTGDLPDPGTERASSAWQTDSLPLSHLGSPKDYWIMPKFSGGGGGGECKVGKVLPNRTSANKRMEGTNSLPFPLLTEHCSWWPRSTSNAMYPKLNWLSIPQLCLAPRFPHLGDNTHLQQLMWAICQFYFLNISVHHLSWSDLESFPGGSDKSLLAVPQTQVWSLGQENSLEKGMATHSSILALRIPWTEEPGGLQSMFIHHPMFICLLSTVGSTSVS